MSWDEDYRHQYPCPCGKGQYEVIGRSDDWGRQETSCEMLCPDCKENYVYDHTVIHGHPGDEVERGWVLKSTLAAEREYKQNVEARAGKLYLAKWRERFASAKTKKEVWSILTLDGQYYPSLGTFYRYHKDKSLQEVIESIDSTFNYDRLRLVFQVCHIDEPDWEYLGLNKADRERFKP